MKTLDERIQFVYDNLAEQEYSEVISNTKTWQLL